MSNMSGLYIVINETKDGRFYGECPLLNGCIASGSSVDEVKRDMLNLINAYLEKQENSSENKGVKNGFKIKNKRRKSSFVPIW